ncbi:MAG: hypothetical protein M1823_005284 [Watsoniomyces obsoletus]|nr:MAG: hypothetical protein M1823_005284 [Watsoniomyces obsoletus]
MTDPTKQSAYGGRPSAEASFRRTWDREAYAAKAASREASEREEGKARYEAKLAGRKYYAPPPSSSSHPPPSSSSTQDNLIDARTSRLDVSSSVGKVHILTGIQATLTGRRGRGAGFYCESCDLTFKDNLQWVDHLNSKQHLVNTGNGNLAEVKRATLEEVRQRLRFLKERKEREEKERKLLEGEGGTGILLEERLKGRHEEMEKERERRREKRRERRRKNGNNGNGDGDGDANGGTGETENGDVKMEDVRIGNSIEEPQTQEEDEEMKMARMMGFQGFGTTKV